MLLLSSAPLLGTCRLASEVGKRGVPLETLVGALRGLEFKLGGVLEDAQRKVSRFLERLSGVLEVIGMVFESFSKRPVHTMGQSDLAGHVAVESACFVHEHSLGH